MLAGIVNNIGGLNGCKNCKFLARLPTLWKYYLSSPLHMCMRPGTRTESNTFRRFAFRLFFMGPVLVIFLIFCVVFLLFVFVRCLVSKVVGVSRLSIQVLSNIYSLRSICIEISSRERILNSYKCHILEINARWHWQHSYINIMIRRIFIALIIFFVWLKCQW